MYILGLSAFYHDSAAALVKDGVVVAAAQEERFTRRRHDPSFPQHAIQYCLSEVRINLRDVDFVVFYDKPFQKFERLLETYLAFAPKGLFSFWKAIPIWIKEKLFQKNLLIKELSGLDKNFDFQNKILFTEHHQAHAASAFYPSPFRAAAVITVDGVGEWTTSSLMVGKDNQLEPLQEIKFPHSLGLLYSAFTYYLGFKVNSGEYKVMGLAPYGQPRYADLIREHLIDIKEDGSFRLNMNYFDYCVGLTMTNRKFSSLFGRAPRAQESALTQMDMDLAASLQNVTEEVVLKMARHARKKTQLENLCLAGGVALNCVANGKILREKIFSNIWVQPAAGDAGGAVGAALAAYHIHCKKNRELSIPDGMNGSYLGPAFEVTEVKMQLAVFGAVFDECSEQEMLERVADNLAREKVVGWFQGRMEFGARALGSRSILGDPRSTQMQSKMNLKIKYRESFRPFAPAVLAEDCTNYFELNCHSPYMTLVAPVIKGRQKPLNDEDKNKFGIDLLNVPKSDIPSVTHVDYSARIQTVHAGTNPLFHNLITTFKKKTGYGLLVNTSFNVRGEPIVCTPKDAYICFMRTEMDILVIGNLIFDKKAQPVFSERMNWRDEFELD